MRGMFLKSLLVVCAVTTLLVIISPDVDAEESYDTEYNCNNYNLSFIYSGGTQGDILVTWSAYGIDENGLHIVVRQIGEPPSKDNNWKVRFNPEDVSQCKFVYINQEVTTPNGSKDSLTIKVNVITPPPAGGFFEVKFFDGHSGALISKYSVYSDKAVEIGGDFVELPGTPVREGYSFVGWFLPTDDPDVYLPFDPKKPVESDLSVIAKWTSDKPVPVPDPEDVVKSLTVSGKYKTNYHVGERLDIRGLVITAEYQDGSSRDVTSLCNFKPNSFDFIGDVTVTVTYEGMKAYFDVTVADVPSSDTEDDGVTDSTDIVKYAIIGIIIILGVIILIRYLGNRGV